MRLGTRLLLALNRLVPRPRFPERPDPLSYATWEYHEAEYQLGLVERTGVSLAASRVLDVGCGLGGKSVRFAESGSGYLLGVDRSREHIRAARGFARARGSSCVEFACADAASLPVPDGSFDVAITTDTFEHFVDPQRCLEEMVRTLRPGGHFIAVFGPFGSPLGSHVYDTIFVPWCHVLFSRDTLAEAIRETARLRAKGLDEERVREVVRRGEESIRYFDNELNRMTLRRFRRMIRGEPRLAIRGWTKWTPPRLRALTPLLAIPLLDEHLTGLLVVVAERVEP